MLKELGWKKYMAILATNMRNARTRIKNKARIAERAERRLSSRRSKPNQDISLDLADVQIFCFYVYSWTTAGQTKVTTMPEILVEQLPDVVIKQCAADPLCIEYLSVSPPVWTDYPRISLPIAMGQFRDCDPRFTTYNDLDGNRVDDDDDDEGEIRSLDLYSEDEDDNEEDNEDVDNAYESRWTKLSIDILKDAGYHPGGRPNTNAVDRPECWRPVVRDRDVSIRKPWPTIGALLQDPRIHSWRLTCVSGSNSNAKYKPGDPFDIHIVNIWGDLFRLYVWVIYVLEFFS